MAGVAVLLAAAVTALDAVGTGATSWQAIIPGAAYVVARFEGLSADRSQAAQAGALGGRPADP